MKKILFLVLIFLPCYSCKKEKIEYINHNSEIFLNEDTLCIGKWDYLYTWSGGGWAGTSRQSFDNLPTINIKPKGNYELIQNDKIILTGILDTLKSSNGSLLVTFYPNGIKTQDLSQHSFRIQETDTLIMGLHVSGDWYSDSYYKRVKD